MNVRSFHRKTRLSRPPMMVEKEDAIPDRLMPA
jgi:hypothetical protein